MNVLLISTYELGHQPFGLASPAAWLRQAGADVTCLDLAVERLDPDAVAAADVVCFYVPMHTATRLAIRAAKRVRAINPDAHLCFYGLYASVNEPLFRELGSGTVLGGEYEGGLVSMVARLAAAGERSSESPQPEPVVSLGRQTFITPDRTGLPSLARYAYITLSDGSQRIAGYTEATRGCKHTCRHCPVVPVYGGQFRIVQRDVVLADIERQVAAGAQHITFGDPDFFNGPGHAIRLVEAMHERWPDLTYDATIKIEHLLKHADKLQVLKKTGCVLVTSAVESVDDRQLALLDKRHTRQDFIDAVALCRDVGLALNPTFVTFMPWTTIPGYLDLLSVIADLDLIENVSPIQYAIRLLIPNGSKLLEVPEVQALVGPIDPEALTYPWDHPLPEVDRLYESVRDIVQQSQSEKATRRQIFDRVRRATLAAAGLPEPVRVAAPAAAYTVPRSPVPYLSEPWYC